MHAHLSYLHFFFLQNNNKLCNLFRCAACLVFFFPGFGWELIQCMLSTDADESWHQLLMIIIPSKASCPFGCWTDNPVLGCLWTSLLSEAWRILSAWVTLTMVFVAQVSSDDRSEALISWFLPLTQPAKSKHKISSIMDLLVFLDLRSCQVNGTLPRQFSGHSVTNFVGKISLSLWHTRLQTWTKCIMRQYKISKYKWQPMATRQYPCKHCPIYKDFPNNNIRKLDCQRHYKK